MKKVVLLFSILFITILLTGCGNEGESVIDNGTRLLCNQKVQTVDVEMIADFKGNELTYLGLQYEMDLSSYNDTQVKVIKAQDMCSIVKNSMSEYTNAFTNCKQNIENKKLLITADFDLDKLIGSELSRETNIEAAKTGLEKQGYTCTTTKK